ncbi:MAG: hypothetical protein GY953_48675 [bacterium]|nr:hypothetical protein [bacterium]
MEHAAAVEAAHPGVVSANIFGGGYRNWYYQPQEAQLLERINTGGCVLLQGEASTVGLVPDFRTEPIFVPDVHEHHGQEGLFRLLPPGEAGR